MDNIVKQNYWDESYKNHIYSIADKNDALRVFLEKNIPDGKGKTAIEIWCFPGRYLSVLWEKWYKLYWIDQTPRVAIDFKEWLKTNWYSVWEIIKGEFPYTKLWEHDVVMSLWFIEHFLNFDKIIVEHLNLVKNNGYIFISTPNFAYWFQKRFHKNFDKKNFNRHVITSMNLDIWKQIVIESWFQIKSYWYLWWFDVWVEDNNCSFFKRSLSFLIRVFNHTLGNLFLKKLPNSKFYSPFIFIFAQKNEQNN